LKSGYSAPLEPYPKTASLEELSKINGLRNQRGVHYKTFVVPSLVIGGYKKSVTVTLPGDLRPKFVRSQKPVVLPTANPISAPN